MREPSWADLEAIFHDALACAPADRAAFLTERCAGRPDLQAEVEALLRAHEGASGAWEMPSVAPQTRLKAGARLGPYEVLAELGAGGMGEVYRAHDRKLGRDVAIKVLPKIFRSDAERLARFEREARMLAALSHPNIAVIHGIEDANGAPALVLELIDGVTLAERLARPIPVTEALTIARQIADALEAAHDKGIIHRDLKPANIKITSAGVVKVLDFGLAKVGARDGAGPDLSQSPTVTTGGTREGMMLGTVAYMSPEQARGQAVDKRTDIWAFGCVLYEMLTGRRAFPGDDVSDTLAGILRGDPDWHALPASTPAAIRRLLRRCLAKERKERLPDIAVARLDIVEMLTSPEGGPDAAPASSRRPLRLWQRPAAAAVIALSLGAGTAGLAVWTLTRPSPPTPVRLTVTPPAGETVGLPPQNPSGGDVAISPDGRRIVFATHRKAGSSQLYVRALDQLEAQPLQVLDTFPRGLFMSPDGNWVGFFDEPDVLRKVPVNGGPAVTICTFPGGPGGASWGPADRIVFATDDPATGLLRVSSGGGKAEVLTTPDAQKGELDHYWPEVLPGGEAVLFTILPTTGGLANAQIAVLDLKTHEQRVLVREGSHPRYVPTGHIVYGVAGTLRAVAFDLGRLEVRSDPVPVLQRVVTKRSGAASFSVAQDGSLVYLAGNVLSPAPRTLVWVDRQGREESITAPPRAYSGVRISPDGTRVAITAFDQEEDIWIWDLRRQTLTRFTFGPALETYPLWTPDGRRIVFSSARAGALNLFWQAADGTGPVERLAESANGQFPASFSPDGTRLLIGEETTSVPTGYDINILPLEGDRRVTPLVKTSFGEGHAEVSPDGHWLAYQSDESGQEEVYVRPFPAVEAGKWQVSTGGGESWMPLWARNGRELFYRVWSGRMMAVPLQPGATFAAGIPQVLFEGPYVMLTPASRGVRSYDVSADGQRFLMIKEGETDKTATAREIVVVQNWFEELKRLVPNR